MNTWVGSQPQPQYFSVPIYLPCLPLTPLREAQVSAHRADCSLIEAQGWDEVIWASLACERWLPSVKLLGCGLTWLRGNYCNSQSTDHTHDLHPT
eukprot:scaffold64562_cov23-Tisochrysis_lutea.AAC.2